MQPLPIHLPSGNLIADRRFEWARDQQAKGDLAAAADLLTQVLELAPAYAAAWFALGEVREKLGERDGAIAAFQEAAQADLQDRHGAALRLVRLGAASAAAMPEGYVRAMFDGYACVFDHTLTERLGYRAPELLLRAVQATSPRMKFGSVLDLGCGTGLAGAAFRTCCDWLVGVDLSPAMLAQARAKGLYDLLVEGEVVNFLGGEVQTKAQYHLILAADVFMYLDDLTAVLHAAAKVLAPSGVIAFSLETHERDGVILRDTLRYAHGVAHVRAALGKSGPKLASLDFAVTRTEKGVPVPGLIVVGKN